MEPRVRDVIAAINQALERAEAQQQATEDDQPADAPNFNATLGFLRSARTAAGNLLRQVRGEA